MTAETIGYGLVIIVLGILAGGLFFIAFDVEKGNRYRDEYQDQDNWGAK
jgi:hypothetical protein